MKKQKDKYEELACEFLNESECEEDIQEEELDLDELEEAHYNDEDESFSKNKYQESDEQKFINLLKKGINAKKAAHIVNRETEKHLKILNQLKGGK